MKSTSFDFDGNDPSEADIVWIWRDDGSWLGIYYNNQDLTNETPPMTRGWKAIGLGDTDASQFTLPENSGFFIQSRKERDWLLVFAGNVNGSPKFLNIKSGYNIVNRGTPWPLRLDECGIEESHGFNEGAGGDQIAFMDANGKWKQYYFNGQWRSSSSVDGYYGHVELPSAFFIYRRGDHDVWVSYLIRPPVGVSPTKNKLGNTPPAPDVSARLGFNMGNPIFEISWPSESPKIVYRTEVFGSHPDIPPEQAGDAWFYLPSRRGTWGNYLSDHALLRWLRYGIVRVSAEWENTQIE